MPGADRRLLHHADRVDQPAGPPGGEPGHVLLGLDRPVERGGEQAVDELGADVFDGGREGVVVEDPGVLAVQLPAQPLDRRAGPAPAVVQPGVGQAAQLRGVPLPADQLRRDRALLQHPDPVEVLQVVDGVGDVVGDVHDRRFDGLLPVGDPAGERLARLPQVADLGAVGAELGRPAVRVVRRRRWPRAAAGRTTAGAGRDGRAGSTGTSGSPARTAAVRSRPMVAVPRISVLVTIRYDWALPSNPSGRPSRWRASRSSTCSPRCPNGGCPRSCASAAASTTSGSQPPRASSRSAYRSSAVSRSAIARPTCGDLQAVGQPVVHQQARPAGADHLRDAAQPGEEGRADDPVPVHPERAAGEIAERAGPAAEQPAGPGRNVRPGRSGGARIPSWAHDQR